MPATYEPIATTTLGSAATSITFSSISSAYTDLRLVLSLIPATGTRAYLQFNSDTGTNYSRTFLYGDGFDASSIRSTNNTFISITPADSSNPSLWVWNLFSYAGSTFKTVLGETSQDANGSGYVSRAVALWRSTSAINSVNVFSTVTNSFAVGTTATLYGIKNA
jgi:hypothetical protein